MPTCPVFTQYMQLGDKDGQISVTKGDAGEGQVIKEVALLQKILDALGFDAGKPDGIYGQKTAKAVGLWQASNYEQVLMPWDLPIPTHWFYQSSKRWMNETLGCRDEVLLDNGVFLEGQSPNSVTQ